MEESVGPRASLPWAPSSPKAEWTPSPVAPGCRLGPEEAGPGFTRVPNRPNQSSRGPPCGDSQEQPRDWCTSPGAVLTESDISGQFSDPKALNGDRQRRRALSPANLNISLRREGAWPLRARALRS